MAGLNNPLHEICNKQLEGIILIRSVLLQGIMFFLVFQGTSFFRETSMLAKATELTQEAIILPTLMGKSLAIKSQGKKTVVYFFAPWCQICHLSISNLQAIYQSNKNIDIIAIALDYNDVSEIEAFSQQHEIGFAIALGNEKVKQAFNVTAYPSYYVLNEQNTITGRSMGYSSELGLYLRAL